MTHIPDLTPVFKNALAIKYAKGEFIVRCEDEPQGIYRMEAGYVKAFSTNLRGDIYVHMLFASGEVFPLVWGISERGTSPRINFQAMSAVTVKRLPRTAFMKHIAATQGGYKLFLEYLAYALTSYNDRVQNLQYRYASERVAYRLLYLASRFAVNEFGTLRITLPLTYADIAHSINLSDKSVTRTIRNLEQKSIISYSRGRIAILDKQRLATELKSGQNDHIIQLVDNI